MALISYVKNWNKNSNEREVNMINLHSENSFASQRINETFIKHAIFHGLDFVAGNSNTKQTKGECHG